jgi:hypothetical protein
MTLVVQKLIACKSFAKFILKTDLRLVVSYKLSSSPARGVNLEHHGIVAESGRLHFFAKEEDVKVPQVQILPVPPVSKGTSVFQCQNLAAQVLTTDIVGR